MRKTTVLFAILVFILFTGMTIVSAQEIKGWISPSDLLNIGGKWYRFFGEVMNGESIGGNAGHLCCGVNFYINRETGLIPLYEQNGVIRPLVGNIQNLPRNITNNTQLVEVTARVKIDFEAGKTTMQEIVVRSRKLVSPLANKALEEGVESYNKIPINPPKIAIKTKVSIPPKIGFVSRIGKFLGFGGKVLSIFSTYQQLRDITEGAFEDQPTPPKGSNIIIPQKLKRPNPEPVLRTVGFPTKFKVEGDKAYYFDRQKYDWVRALDPEMVKRIKKAYEIQQNK